MKNCRRSQGLVESIRMLNGDLFLGIPTFTKNGSKKVRMVIPRNSLSAALRTELNRNEKW